MDHGCSYNPVIRLACADLGILRGAGQQSNTTRTTSQLIEQAEHNLSLHTEVRHSCNSMMYLHHYNNMLAMLNPVACSSYLRNRRCVYYPPKIFDPINLRTYEPNSRTVQWYYVQPVALLLYPCIFLLQSNRMCYSYMLRLRYT